MKSWLKMGALIAITLGVISVVPSGAHAAVLDGINDREPGNYNKADITNILVFLIKYLMTFAAAISAVFVVVSGYQYILAAGNPEKLEKAKMGLTWSLIGLVLAGSAAAIVFLLQNTLQSKQTIPLGRILGINQPATVLSRLMTIIFTFAGGVAVLYLILGGYRYVTSQGNPELAEKAKTTVLYAVIGLAVVMLSYAIFILARTTVFGRELSF